MKVLTILVLASVLGGGIYFLMRTPAPKADPPKQEEDGNGGKTRNVGPGGTAGIPSFPSGTPPMPLGGQSQIFEDFVKENGLSESESSRFYAALNESDQEMRALAKFDEATKMPIMPKPEDLEATMKKRGELLSDALGADRYGKFKAYQATLPIRRTLDRLGESGNSISLSPEQRAAIFSAAYDKIDGQGLMSSPREYVLKLGNAVLEESSIYLSDDDQKRFSDALKSETSRGFLPPVGGDLPNLPQPPIGLVPPPPGSTAPYDIVPTDIKPELIPTPVSPTPNP